jgi:tetratricopeptide (TPR) repeat protein/predicted Ser/Thr protein kinase
MRRLQDALELYLAQDAGAGGDELLAANPELRELLEPMLGGDEGAAQEGVIGRERWLGEFRILRVLGRGSFGVVYEAEQTSLQRRVALKVMSAPLADADQAPQRFAREAQALATLDHNNVVAVHSAGVEDGVPWLVLDYVEGRSLADLLQERRAHAQPLDVATAARTGIAIAEALQHAHARGILHRDVKPANVLLRQRDGAALLTDFGLARIAGAVSLTRSGAVLGTPAYLAPEQLAGPERQVDARADVYALGVTLYEMVTLRRPFDGESTHQVVRDIVTREPERPDRINKELPLDFVAILQRALEKEPRQRYASAAELAADLRALLAHRPVRARVLPVRARLARWLRREPVKAALVVLLLAGVPAATGLGGYLVANRSVIELGARAKAEHELEELLAEGFAELGEGLPARAVPAFERALALDPDCEEAVAGLAVHALRTRGRAAAIAFLDQREPLLSRSTVLQRQRQQFERLAGVPVTGAEPGPATTPKDLFVSGLLEVEAGHRGERGAFARAVTLLHRANLGATRQRYVYVYEWAHAVGHARDRESQALVEAALARLPQQNGRVWFWLRFLYQYTDPMRVLPAARRSVELLPGDASAVDGLVLVLSESPRREDHEEALALCQQQVARPGASGLQWRNLGVVSQLLGRKHEARQAYLRAVELTPRDPECWSGLAQMHRDLGQHSEAEAAIRKALGLRDDGAKDHMLLGQLLTDRGEQAAAIAHLQRGLELDPGQATGYYNLGLALSRAGRLPEARDSYARSLELCGDDPKTLNNLGLVLRRLRDHAAAEPLIREALRLQPNLREAHENLTSLHDERRDYAAMLAAARAWTERFPKEAKAWAARGWAEFRVVEGDLMPDYSAAHASAQKAVELSGGTEPRHLQQLATVLHELGRSDEAIELLTRAQTLAREQNQPKAGVRDVIDATLARVRREARRR